MSMDICSMGAHPLHVKSNVACASHGVHRDTRDILLDSQRTLDRLRNNFEVFAFRERLHRVRNHLLGGNLAEAHALVEGLHWGWQLSNNTWVVGHLLLLTLSPL